MNTNTTIAKAASVAALGLFALAPAFASPALAAPAAQSVGVLQMGAGSAGSGDSHGHNSQPSAQQAPIIPSAGLGRTGASPQLPSPNRH